MYGFYRVACARPALRLADVDHNAEEIVALAKRSEDLNTAVTVFPELSVTGYTCGDLFRQTPLLDGAASAITSICAELSECDGITIVGAPAQLRHRLYNCAFVIQGGEIRGVVPKSVLPNYREFYEHRWFSSGADIVEDAILIDGVEIPFGVDLTFQVDERLTVGVEICEDLWSVIPPSSHHALAGATVLANLSASNELVAKAEYRRNLVKTQSARCVAAYLYSSSGLGESSTDLVYGGHGIIAENGIVLQESSRFDPNEELIHADVDCERLVMTRIGETSYGDNAAGRSRVIQMDPVPQLTDIDRVFAPHPFVPADDKKRDAHCREIFNIQASGLARRIQHAEAKAAVIGISGGLDSTLALLVACEANRQLGPKLGRIIAVSMPGFGTSDRTSTNARKLGEILGCDYREIDITDACELHLQDIGYDGDRSDPTFENVQARERTQILMNIANREHGLVVGTGDLSEMALGWSTYNGDHMSMYAVNSGVPKTLVRYVIQWVADGVNDDLNPILIDILDTPVTPELLPAAADGTIHQETEALIGPYELHDFFLYHMLKYGASPEKVNFLAQMAFDDRYTPKLIDKWLRVFIERFFRNQFKRSCMPDGPKVGTIALSPRGDWRMPSDASDATWNFLRDRP